MKRKANALFKSVISLILCFSMLVGTTFAWFTDSVKSGINTIAAGNLDVELYHTNAAVTDERVNAETKLFMDLQGNPILWEPGVVSYENLRVANEGDLALAYQLAINTANENFILDPANNTQYGLSQILKVGVVEGGITATDRAGVVASVKDTDWTTLATFLRSGSLLPVDGQNQQTWGVVIYWQPGEDDNRWNLNNGKVLSEGETLQIDLGVKLVATQEVYESDSFGDNYDTEAKAFAFPNFVGGSASAAVVPNDQGQTTAAVTMDAGVVSATVPAGAQLAAGVTKLTLNVSMLGASGSNITLGEDEAMRSLDVHVDGLAENNTVPVTVTLKEAAPKGLNMGNYKVYHVEKDGTKEMTLVDASADFTAHNQFKYDPATGDVTLYMATFSEVAVVADLINPWEGKFNYDWYDASKTELTIANADQLAAFGAIVGGMNGQTRDSFAGKSVKLISDINLGDKESENNPNIIFYPIGYWNNEGTYERKPLEERETAVSSGLRNFEGTFDGNGHTVSNFYHNTWEMKGDHDWYNTTTEQYYRDGMGLFGRVYKGAVKNLTVKNFSSDGEIATTGVIAAYADGATFENIAIFNCNPRVYNIGNGGIVGCVGWYAKDAGLKTTFKNITVDNSNKISALWGSYDVACGGIVGQYYPTSGQSSAGTPKNGGVHFENCHISAQMDVYNDVCANYQYYAYRYTGMLIGSVRENVTIDGHSYPKMDGITAKDCTVHFGTWNDYYYCEIIDNTTASYTHDYQMSRLTEIKAIDGKAITYLDGTTGTVPASGRANYVIVDYTKGHGTENATCYHFKDGAVWTHDMGGIQTGIDENGDGQDDLKEDKQHIYLEFNNLVTGYGWGVTSKVVGELDGVTILDREVGNSVEKFISKITIDSDALVANKAYNIGDLFAEVDGINPAVNGSAVQVAVTGAENSGIIATYVANPDNWATGTLTFNKIEGICSITIQDYNFCKPTTIILKDGKLVENVEKFAIALPNTDKYLYRVGNQNEVALGSLFKENGYPVDDASVEVSISLTDKCKVTLDSANWTKGTLEFTNNFTGLVTVTITENEEFSKELKLEVVEAKNCPSPTSTVSLDATANNVVLLNDATSDGFSVKDGYSFYGNGFTVTCAGKGTYLGHGGMTLGYASVQTGGVLDNVKIICDVYPQAFAYTSEVEVTSNLDTVASTTDRLRYMYQLSAIAVSGDGSTVSNCYAYGGRNNIFVGGGDVTIENTVTECGTLANIQLKGSADDTVILKDVTTIQYKTTSKYDTSKVMLGFGIAVGDNESESNANIILQGDLKQYNWVTSKDGDVSNTYAKSAISGALSVKEYQHTINGETAVNMGIAYLNTCTKVFPAENDQRINKPTVPYSMSAVRIQSKDGYVYSIAGSGINGTNRYDATADGVIPYVSNTQGDVRPEYEFALGNQAVNGEDRYLTGDINGVTARYENGQQPFSLDITKLMTATKYGKACSVSATCTDPDGKVLSETVTLNKAGTYSLKFTIKDTTFYSATGEEVNNKERSYTYSVPIKLTIAEPSVPNATLTVDTSKDYEGKYTDSTSDGSKKMSFNPLDPIIKVTDAGTEFNLKSNVKSVDISYSAFGTDGNGNAFSGNTTITVTYKEGQVLSIVFQKVESNSPGNPKSVTYNASTGEVKSSNTLARTSCTDAKWKVVSYSFTGKNGKTVTANGVTFKIPADTSGGCFTPETLITLADGTQKEIQHLTAEDMLLVWDFHNGEYTYAPSAIIFNHGTDNFRVLKLKFSDGTTVEVIQDHFFFDLNTNEFVTIGEYNVDKYVGHKFAKAGNDFSAVTLVGYDVEEEYTTSYSVLSAVHYNCIAEGMLTLSPNPIGGNFFMPFEVGEDMKFDAEKMQADIEKYGLFTYEEFAAYATAEQFFGLNGPQIKVAVGKGIITMEQLFQIIAAFLPEN